MIRSASPPRRSRRTENASRPATGETKVNHASTLQHIPIDAVDSPRRPPRRFLGDVPSLADSMQEYGLQQPISVRAEGQRFVLISGMRRLAAARLLQWTTISAFVRTVTADDAYVLDLIENLQREDLSPEEEADAFGELVRTRGWTLQQVADSVKRSVGYVSKRVRVFEDPGLRRAITTDGLPVSTAEELLASVPEQRDSLIQRALAEHWDQIQAREALRGADVREEAPAAEATSVEFGEDRPRGRMPQATYAGSIEVRPKEFARVIREFHRMLLGIRSEDLTRSNRAALRALFRDLLLLARAPSATPPTVFPPLPTSPQPSRSGRQTASRTARGRAAESRPS